MGLVLFLFHRNRDIALDERVEVPIKVVTTVHRRGFKLLEPSQPLRNAEREQFVWSGVQALIVKP